MKKLQSTALFFAISLLLNCKGTTDPTPEPTPDPVLAMVGSYEGDFSIQCKDAKGQGAKETSKKAFSISRIGNTDSITVVSTNGFVLKAKTTGSTFVFNKTDLGGEIHTGTGALTGTKLTMSLNADATVAYGYSCVKEFSGTKKAQ
jgi:hypothetical protein